MLTSEKDIFQNLKSYYEQEFEATRNTKKHLQLVTKLESQHKQGEGIKTNIVNLLEMKEQFQIKLQNQFEVLEKNDHADTNLRKVIDAIYPIRVYISQVHL